MCQARGHLFNPNYFKMKAGKFTKRRHFILIQLRKVVRIQKVSISISYNPIWLRQSVRVHKLINRW